LGFNQISSINPSSLSGLYSLQELYYNICSSIANPKCEVVITVICQI